VEQALSRYEGPLMRYAFRLTGSRFMAEDVVQDTFLRLCKADRAKVEHHLATWLYTVCRNRAMDLHRKERRMDRMGSDATRLPSLDVPLPAQAEAADEHAAVRGALAELSVQQQEVVRLKFQMGLSYKEISEVTGLTVSNVGYHIHAALQRVRHNMLLEREAAGRHA
jgi:RNA polymerase sigma-70 factor (ECF subfamily)